MEKKSLDTLCVHGGYVPLDGESRVAPIFQSTAFSFNNADHVAALFDLEKEGHMYSRISNPTVEILEKKIASLEGGVGALCTSSGQAATLLAVLTICSEGDHIVAFNNIYGGTFTLFSSTLKGLGIDTTFVDLNAQDEDISKLIHPNTKLLFGETIANPLGQVLDIRRFANLAHKHGIPLVVDNTFPTPVLSRPFEFGADIVTHSTTKYLDGHATSVGGAIVDSGSFDWENGKFPGLTEKDPSYHGLSYTEKFGKKAFIQRARVVFLRDLGTSMSPFNAFLTNLGIETLALRMEKHSTNALTVAKYLESNPYVEWVNYPLLESSPDYSLAQEYLADGASGVVTFAIKGGIEQGKQFIDNLELVSLAVHVGDVRSLVLHPASTTHRQLSAEDKKIAGIADNMIRLSVGIEDVQEIIRDIENALRKSQR